MHTNPCSTSTIGESSWSSGLLVTFFQTSWENLVLKTEQEAWMQHTPLIKTNIAPACRPAQTELALQPQCFRRYDMFVSGG